MANFFTKQQIDDIRTALASDAKSDLELPETTEITNNDYVAIVQNGLNKKIKADSFKGETGATGPQGPQGPQGIQGPEGQQGPQGDPGITSASVTVDNTSGTPTATATITNQNLNIAFTGLKGPQGEQGPAGQDGRDGSDADVTATNITNALGYTPASQDSDAVTGNVAEFDSSGNPVDSGVAADNIAEQDGYYETMVVGGAENLIGNDIVSSQFTRRKTGGSADVGTGVAIFKTIKGNTLVWNQLVTRYNNTQTSLSVTATFSTDGTISLSGTANGGTATFSVPGLGNYSDFVQGHKYLLWGCPSGGANSTYSIRYNNNGYGETGAGIIVTCGSGGSGFLNRAPIIAINNGVDATGLVFKPQMIDLTQMFGSGNEPSTVAEFRALFPLNLYDSVTPFLLNLTATGLQTNGWNQWDEEWESGAIDGGTGQNTAIADRIRSKNYIPAFGSTTYFMTAREKPNTTFVVFYYDIDTQYISNNNVTNSTFTTPNNAAFIRFCTATAYYGTTYLNDICINLSDVNKNGTYEPYWSETKALPITTMTGKVNGEGESVVMLPNGARRVGTTCDETDGIKTWNRIGKRTIDGQTNFFPNAITASTFTFYLTDTNMASSTGTISDKAGYCASYNSTATELSMAVYTANRLFITVPFGWCGTNSSQTLAQAIASFKNWLVSNPIELYYIKATPIEYVNDTPLNLQYRVDNDGTETILPENTSTPTTSPIVADINYALNAIDTIRNLPQNYISKASMDAILTAFKTAGVITNYTLTWDATNQKYNCSITA